MRFLKSLIATAVVSIALHGAAMAAEKCYEETPVPAEMICNDNESKSADFTSGCKYTESTVTKKEVECPARWINASGKESQAKVCSAAGLKSADIDGQVCAAGEKRPSTGTNYQAISYRYGKWGSGGGEGGTIVQARSRRQGSLNDDGPTKFELFYFCWTSSGKRDYDTTDIAVAYACE